MRLERVCEQFARDQQAPTSGAASVPSLRFRVSILVSAYLAGGRVEDSVVGLRRGSEDILRLQPVTGRGALGALGGVERCSRGRRPKGGAIVDCSHWLRPFTFLYELATRPNLNPLTLMTVILFHLAGASREDKV